jgi:hypothetical protein
VVSAASRACAAPLKNDNPGNDWTWPRPRPGAQRSSDPRPLHREMRGKFVVQHHAARRRAKLRAERVIGSRCPPR